MYSNRLLCKIIIFGLLCLFSTLLHAKPVYTVYRADSRAYGDVFQNGFQAWGNNINFNAHILGISTATGSRNSAFISTTSSEDVADRFARERTLVLSQPYYIYNIRPTNNFYSALNTMYHLYDLHNVRVPNTTRATLAKEQEYAAYSYISPVQIRSVTVLEYVDGVIHQLIVLNPHYQYDVTHTNTSPYTGSDSDQLNVSPRLLVSPSGLGASFTSDSEDTDYHFPTWTLNCISSQSEI